jgi:uncharacterized protein (DUF2336 family)
MPHCGDFDPDNSELPWGAEAELTPNLGENYLEQFWFGRIFGNPTRRSLPGQCKLLVRGPILSWRFFLQHLIALLTARCRPLWQIVTMQHAHTLLTELEVSLAERPSSRRFTILRKLTDLLLAGAESFSDDSIQVFDELMDRLIVQIERQALIELSNRLAPVQRAPLKVIARLSRNDDIEIAEPVLEQSSVLTDQDLVQIAKTKSQAHLYAIAGRTRISEPVTEILVDRGDSKVAAKVAANEGARFSRWAFTKAVERAEEDQTLALAVANRIDLPTDLLDQLVRKATKVVQQRLMAISRPEIRQKISEALTVVSVRLVRSTTSAGRGGRTLMKQDSVQLRTQISQYTDGRNISGLIDTLATLAELPVRTVTKLVEAESDEILVALGKACGIGWPDLKKAISVLVPADVALQDKSSALFEMYASLSPADAKRALQFIRTNTSRSTERIRELAHSKTYRQTY